MSSGPHRFSHKHREGMLSAISIGFFLILIGTIFILNPDLPKRVTDFAETFELKAVPTNLNVYLPVPRVPSDHLFIYQILEQFCLVWAVFLVAMLGARFIIDSSVRNKAEGLGNIVFWFGAAFMVQTLLVDTARVRELDTARWFGFWASIVALIGFSLITRAVFIIVAWKIYKD